jgi:hypothetical protein
LEEVEDAADVGVGDLAGHLDFAAKAGDGAGIAGDGGEDGFDGDREFEFEVLGFVDLAHGAGAEAASDLEAVGEDFAGLEGVVRGQ